MKGDGIVPLAIAQSTKIYYEWRQCHPLGGAPGDLPLLLIMGLGGSRLGWGEALLDPLSDACDLLLVDNRGAGRSDKPDGPYSMAQMASDAVAVLDAAGVERAHLFGVSMGGMIAQHVALDHPARVAKLVLGCTFSGGHEAISASDDILDYLSPPLQMAALAAALWGLPASYTPEFIEHERSFLEERMKRLIAEPTPRACVDAQARAIRKTHRTFARLPEISAKTLLITGDRDELIPPQNSDILVERIPHARLHVIDGAAHSFG